MHPPLEDSSSVTAETNAPTALARARIAYELKEIGDWSSSKMPEIYAERKGIIVAQRRWSEDVRRENPSSLDLSSQLHWLGLLR